MVYQVCLSMFAHPSWCDQSIHYEKNHGAQGVIFLYGFIYDPGL